LVLRTLAELHEELGRATARCDAAGWQALSDALLALLARPHGDLRPLAKATSNCNALLIPWLERHPGARALALRIALEPWLATLLKSPAAVADALRFAPARLQDLHARVGEASVRLPALSVPEQLALGWIAERARFAAARAAHGERVLELDFAALLDGGSAVLARIAEHFGLAHDDAALARAWHPEVLGRYAKARDHAYSRADRDADLAQARRRFAAEIGAGLRYAETLYARYPALPR
ncbi:MAG TPA: hypothetical protein VFO79_09145, partial [Xanthomonadales bacterium]|nr:hypothetical protein [Xanthomonadales bacterium]